VASKLPAAEQPISTNTNVERLTSHKMFFLIANFLGVP
jgi:hypothetical protein